MHPSCAQDLSLAAVSLTHTHTPAEQHTQKHTLANINNVAVLLTSLIRGFSFVIETGPVPCWLWETEGPQDLCGWWPRDWAYQAEHSHPEQHQLLGGEGAAKRYGGEAPHGSCGWRWVFGLCDFWFKTPMGSIGLFHAWYVFSCIGNS